MATESADGVEKCPVDHKTREKWLETARAQGKPEPVHPTVSQVGPSPLSRFSLDIGAWQPLPQSDRAASKGPTTRSLPTDREVSSIPRAILTADDRAPNAAERAAMPANSEAESGHDRDTGNWIYPSQEMFFAAMRRKGHAAQAADMATVVPIHNAVNERAWAEIRAWEAGRGAERCGGPRLVSFAGDSKALTPRARWKSFVGYQEPFDRHDWVVDRCGTHVDYVIDFYAGRDEKVPGKNLSFYLDVRPKLNSWAGIKTRVMRAVGA